MSSEECVVVDASLALDELESRGPELMVPCATPEELWLWVKHHLGLGVPRQAVCEGHAAPFEYLVRAYFEPARDLVVWAPRGGGKTRLAAAASLLDMLHKPGTAVRILGGSLDQSMRTWEYLSADTERLCPELVAGKPRARGVRLSNGSSAAVLTQSQRAVRGLHVEKLRCDEVELFDPRVWEAAQLVPRSSSRDGRAVRGVVEAISTLHALSGLMERIVEQAGKSASAGGGAVLLKWSLLDVLERCGRERPCEQCALLEDCRRRAKRRCDGFVPIDDAIAMKRRVGAQTWSAEMLCNNPRPEGVVFREFNPDVHVCEAPAVDPASEGGFEIWMAIDFGYSAPFVCLWVRRDGAGRSFVFDEYVEKGRTLEANIRACEDRGHGRPRFVACDPAGNAVNSQTARSDAQLLKARDYRVVSCGSQIVEGVTRVRSALAPAQGPPMLYVHPRCKKLIKAFASYRYPHDGTELPDKDGVHDHPLDALRYYFANSQKGKVIVDRY